MLSGSPLNGKIDAHLVSCVWLGCGVAWPECDMYTGRAFDIFSVPAFLLTAPVTPFIYIIASGFFTGFFGQFAILMMESK